MLKDKNSASKSLAMHRSEPTYRRSINSRQPAQLSVLKPKEVTNSVYINRYRHRSMKNLKRKSK